MLGAKSFFKPVDSLKILGIKVSTIGWFKWIPKKWKNKKNWYKLHQQHSNKYSLDSPVTSKYMLLTSHTLMLRKKKSVSCGFKHYIAVSGNVKV